MSMTAEKPSSLKALEKTCKSIDFQIDRQNVIVTSPYPEAILASVIIARAISKSGSLFHISYSDSLISIGTLNDFRDRFDSSALLLVGVDLVGKKRIKKGKGYPLIIGGLPESEQANSLKIGNNSTIAAAGYVFAKSLTDLHDYNLQLAAVGTLLNENMNGKKRGANKDIFELVTKAGLIEERKGFRLFGASMLPLNEALLYSTHPYLPKISGNQKVCDEILNEAEIPIPKLRTPISNLSSAEAQRLTSVLITRLDPTIIPHLLGTDYILRTESDTSPLKYVSGINIMNTTSWTRNEIGAMISVLLGDRSRALRALIDSHMTHHRDVISSIQRIETNLEGASTTTTTTVKLAGTKSEILADVGRIALNTGIVDTSRPVALDNDESFTIVWPSSNLNIKMVHHAFLNAKIRITASSPQSITIDGTKEEKEDALKKIVQLDKEVDSK